MRPMFGRFKTPRALLQLLRARLPVRTDDVAADSEAPLLKIALTQIEAAVTREATLAPITAISQNRQLQVKAVGAVVTRNKMAQTTAMASTTSAYPAVSILKEHRLTLDAEVLAEAVAEVLAG
jgi:hypothetical protein